MEGIPDILFTNIMLADVYISLAICAIVTVKIFSRCNRMFFSFDETSSLMEITCGLMSSGIVVSACSFGKMGKDSPKTKSENQLIKYFSTKSAI